MRTSRRNEEIVGSMDLGPGSVWGPQNTPPLEEESVSDERPGCEKNHVYKSSTKAQAEEITPVSEQQMDSYNYQPTLHSAVIYMPSAIHWLP